MNERTLFNEQKGSKSDYEYEIFSLKRTGNIKRERESCYTCWYCDLDSAGTATKQVFSGGGWLGGWLVRGSNSMKWAMIENLGRVSKVSLPSCDWGDGGCRLRVSFVRSRTLVTLGEEGDRVKSACCHWEICGRISLRRRQKTRTWFYGCFLLCLVLSLASSSWSFQQSRELLGIDIPALHFNQSRLQAPDPFLRICCGGIKMHEKLNCRAPERGKRNFERRIFEKTWN